LKSIEGIQTSGTVFYKSVQLLAYADGVTEDARKLRERNWRNAANNRGSWQKLLKKALAQKGLLCQ